MRRRRLILLLAGLLLLYLVYSLWRAAGRGLPPSRPDLRLAQAVSFGKDCGHGNLLGIQPFMVPADYASADRLYAKLAGYLRVAKQRHWLGPKTVVIFPEYIGAWLVVAGEKRGVYEAETVNEAVTTVALSNLPHFVRWLPFTRRSNRAEFAVFRMKGRAMAAAYQQVFSRLAREAGCTVVAGSTILPHPRLENGAVQAGGGPLANVSAVYDAHGRAQALTGKHWLTAEEQAFAGAWQDSYGHVTETPAGRLGVVICADSWFPYPHLKAGGAEIVAVPAFLAGDGACSRRWQGYSGQRAPAGVDPRDVGRLTEGEAWLKYALPGRIASCGARAGMTVYLRGKLWDLGSDGEPLVVSQGRLSTCPPTDGATIANLWL